MIAAWLGAASVGAGTLLLGRGVVLAPVQRAVAAARPDPEAGLRRLRVPLAGLAALGGWTFLGGGFGVVAGGIVAALCWRVLSRVESPAVARRRGRIERDLPIAIQLLSAALSAGAAPMTALLVVADAVSGPVAEELRRTHHRLLLGVDPVSVWRTVEGPLQPLGRAMARAHETGASVRAAIEDLADELRAEGRQRTEALARSVEVRAAAPLGVCFLPAFVLLGVVPMTVAIFSSIRLFS